MSETTYKKTKNLWITKLHPKTSYRIVPHNILYKTKYFFIAKEEGPLSLTKLISKKWSQYINTLDRKILACIDKKMPDKSEAMRIPKIKLITPEKKHIAIFT